MRRHRSRRRNKQRNIIIISACTILLFMTVGYAAMSTNLEINAKGNVIKKDTLGEDLIESAGVVSSGDGLYKDGYEENVYTYRGSNPNNYVTFNNELWRIISVNTADNTMKILKEEPLENRAFDTSSNGRYDGQYCNDSGGCNIYGSTSTLYDINLSPITTLAREVGKTAYNLPIKEASLNTYLNETYYNSLNDIAKEMIVVGIYKVGILEYNSPDMTTDINRVNSVKWKGKVALIDITEYVRASTYSSCENIHSLWPQNTPCGNQNYMFSNFAWWTISPYSHLYSNRIWYIDNKGIFYGSYETDYDYGVRPVVTLSPEVKITSGDGTQNNSYQLSL